MALDHSRLGLENKFLENKSGRIFLRSTRFTLQNLANKSGVCKPTFYTFYTSHLRWNSDCFYHTDLGQNAYFTIFQDKLHSFNIRSNHAWAFSETVQKISKITYTASRFSLLCKLSVWSSVWMNINRVTLQHNKEFIMFIFCYLMVL